LPRQKNMATSFDKIRPPETLHSCVTRTLGLQLIQAGGATKPVILPNEEQLCIQLGVSRSILRESLKVLADKGMLEVRPRSGMRSRPRDQWNLLDPDILAWSAEVNCDVNFLRDLCEVRLAIEPTAAGFAAIRATEEDIKSIEECLAQREAVIAAADYESLVNLDLQFHAAVVLASHNPIFRHLSNSIREPFRMTLSFTTKFAWAVTLGLTAHRKLVEAIKKHDALGARTSADKIVGYAMLAIEQLDHKQEEYKKHV